MTEGRMRLSSLILGEISKGEDQTHEIYRQGGCKRSAPGSLCRFRDIYHVFEQNIWIKSREKKLRLKHDACHGLGELAFGNAMTCGLLCTRCKVINSNIDYL